MTSALTASGLRVAFCVARTVSIVVTEELPSRNAIFDSNSHYLYHQDKEVNRKRP